jgi:SHS family lactate transporter-like MFS transporter
MVRGADTGWRVMLWIGILPALLVFWIVRNVRESPVWLERQRHLKDRHERDPVSLGSLFKPDLLPITLQASLFMGALLFFYHSITFWYPTLLGQLHRDQLPFLVALNAGGIVGNVVWGRISEGRVGRRGAAAAALLVLRRCRCTVQFERRVAACWRARHGPDRRRLIWHRAGLPE